MSRVPEDSCPRPSSPGSRKLLLPLSGPFSPSCPGATSSDHTGKITYLIVIIFPLLFTYRSPGMQKKQPGPERCPPPTHRCKAGKPGEVGMKRCVLLRGGRKSPSVAPAAEKGEKGQGDGAPILPLRSEIEEIPFKPCICIKAENKDNPPQLNNNNK